MTNLSSRSLVQVMPHSTEKKKYLFRGILIKQESPLLREQKRCVDPSDKSCIINQYKQTFMTIMDALEIEVVLPNVVLLSDWFI